MTRLNSPHRKTFTREDFKQHYVWVWDDENEGFLPISDSRFTTEYGTPFIKASFQSDRHKFDGILIGFGPFYAFELFVDDEIIGFNVKLTSLIQQELDKLFEKLGCVPYPLFPLEYVSPVSLQDGTAISGKFILKDDKLLCVPNN